MASAILSENDLTCPVCFEIYREPHALPACLHTFCLACITKFKQGSKVCCPECREVTNFKDIKKDFKTQRFIERLEKDETGTQHSDKVSTELCGMCENSEKCIKYRCEECDYFMCEQCEKMHSKIRDCRWHTVTSKQPKTSAKVTKVDTKHSYLATRFLSLTNKFKYNYVYAGRTQIGHPCYKLCDVGKNIWCCGQNKITIYNKDNQRFHMYKEENQLFDMCTEEDNQRFDMCTEEITSPKFKDLRAIAYYKNKVIVACRFTGLYEINIHTRFISPVIKGRFWDVCVFGDYLYALEGKSLEETQCKVIVYKFRETLQKVKEMILPCGNRLSVSPDSIHVSSRNSSSIFIYNMEGCLDQKLETWDNTSLCDVDKEGNCLVVDHSYDRVFDIRNSKWFKVTFENFELKTPLHAVADKNRNLWIGTEEGFLVKCVPQVAKLDIVLILGIFIMLIQIIQFLKFLMSNLNIILPFVMLIFLVIKRPN